MEGAGYRSSKVLKQIINEIDKALAIHHGFNY